MFRPTIYGEANLGVKCHRMVSAARCVAVAVLQPAYRAGPTLHPIEVSQIFALSLAIDRTMIESFLFTAPIVLQTLPTIYPLSGSASPKRRINKAEMSRKRSKRLNVNHHAQGAGQELPDMHPVLQLWYSKAAGLVDQMLCCSYSGGQLSTEPTEVEYKGNDSLVGDIPSLRLATELRDDPEEFIFMDGRKSPLLKTPIKASKGFKTTDSMVTVSTANSTTAFEESLQSWNSLPSRGSTVSFESQRSLPDYLISKRPSEISVPSSKLYKSYRHHTDPALAEQALIRMVQEESLAALPYLSATEGYPC